MSIKNFNEFLNESWDNDDDDNNEDSYESDESKYTKEKSDDKISIHNILEYKAKLTPIILDSKRENLISGFRFATNQENLELYKTDSMTATLIDNFISDLNDYIAKKHSTFYDKIDDKGYSGYKATGSKYKLTKDMDISEISKLVRKELSIEYPTCKFSVKISRFAGGQALDVNINDIDFNPFSVEYQEFLEGNEPMNEWWKKVQHTSISKYNEKYINFEKKIKGIVFQYNMNDSDSQTDYFHVRYYGHVDLSDDAMIVKFHPNHKETSEKIERWAKYDQERKAKNDKSAERKGKYKKGDEIIYVYNPAKVKYIPAGEYPAKILKSPNGRARFSKYEIEFYITKRLDNNGNLIELSKPVTYTTTVFSEESLKPKQ